MMDSSIDLELWISRSYINLLSLLCSTVKRVLNVKELNNYGPKNYRPISLLSNINNIFEKLMYKRLDKFLTDHNYYEHQFGFWQNHSTNHARISLTEQIRKALDNIIYVGRVFIDLQKAVDTVGHKILLGKLDHYGISGKANGLNPT